MIPALLKWIGNKQRFAQTIVSYIPNEFNNYYEPFLGSGAVMAELLSSDKVFNTSYGSDILPFLIEIFEIVKNNPQNIKDYYKSQIEEYYLNPEKKYLEIRERFNSNFNALDFCILSRTCYSGVIRFRKADGYMSTPRGSHKPISSEVFSKRVDQWSGLLKRTIIRCEDYKIAMNRALEGDVIYCDPPYTHSQSIIYGSHKFNVDELFEKIEECKHRGVKVILSINGTRNSKKEDISVIPPDGLFERKLFVNCGTSMIDRLQHTGEEMIDKEVEDQLLLTW